MSTQIQWRRGTTAQHNVFTGASGEVTVDTDKYTLVVHDGSTVGGFPLARESQVATLSANVYTKEESNTSLALKVDKLIGKGLSTEDYSTAEKTKLDGLSNYTKPSAEPISYITGLQGALDAKATTTALNTEKGRIDAMLLAADANADTFAEVVTLVNSIDTTNDQAFAGYVLSNDARSTTIEGNVTSLTSSKADKATTYTKSETDAKIIELAPATNISGKADKATTLAGYGITNADTSAQVTTKINNAVAANTVNLKEIGVDQTWQDLTSSRSIGTTYTNSTGKPIQVCVSINNSSVNNFYIDGVVITSNNSTTFRNLYYVIIPNNTTYRIAGGALSKWSELR